MTAEAAIFQQPAPVSPPVTSPVSPVPIELPTEAPVSKPASLPLDLLEMLSHNNPSVRKLAVQELIGLLDGKHLGLAHAAQEKLREIAETDDSLTLRRIAAQELSERGFEADSTVSVVIQPAPVVIQKEKVIEPPPSPPKDSSPMVKRPEDPNPLPRLTGWKPVLPKLERRLVGGILGITLGVVFLAGASQLIINGIPILARTPTASITPTPPPPLTSTITPILTQTGSPTPNGTLTATPTRTLTSTPTATRTFLPTFTAKPTRRRRDDGGGGSPPTQEPVEPWE
jgi:hypothetical protein